MGWGDPRGPSPGDRLAAGVERFLELEHVDPDVEALHREELRAELDDYRCPRDPR